MKTPLKMVFAMLASTILVLGLIALLKHLDLDQPTLDFLDWAKSAGLTGQLWFSVAVSMAVVLLLPSVLLTTGAGFLYGVVTGSILIVFAETLGAFLAFLIGRLLAGSRLHRRLLRHTVLQKIDIALSYKGWQIIALIRMIPFFPFKLSNYFFGLTEVYSSQYVLGTFIGLWPISIFNVYLGSIASDLLTLDAGGSEKTSLEWAMYIGGFLITIGLLYFVAVRVQYWFEQHDPDQADSGQQLGD